MGKRNSEMQSPHTTPHWLVGVGGDVEGNTYHIGGRVVTIGRGVSNYIQTTDKLASRVHCQLRPAVGRLQVLDMNSGNGTFVNGEQVSGAYMLADGDMLKVGDVAFRYHAQAGFQQNDGLARKEASQRAMRETDLGNSAGLKGLLETALEASGGDPMKAAESFGMDPVFFARMLKHHGLGAED